MGIEEPVAGYTPPTVANTNQDAGALAALVEQLVNQRMQQLGVQPPPPELTPEEAARKAIDNRGVGLGIDERLAELYRHLDTLAKKVGI